MSIVVGNISEHCQQHPEQPSPDILHVGKPYKFLEEICRIRKLIREVVNLISKPLLGDFSADSRLYWNEIVLLQGTLECSAYKAKGCGPTIRSLSTEIDQTVEFNKFSLKLLGDLLGGARLSLRSHNAKLPVYCQIITCACWACQSKKPCWDRPIVRHWFWPCPSCTCPIFDQSQREFQTIGKQ